MAALQHGRSNCTLQIKHSSPDGCSDCQARLSSSQINPGAWQWMQVVESSHQNGWAHGRSSGHHSASATDSITEHVQHFGLLNHLAAALTADLITTRLKLQH
jgi:hypothetical protein